MKRHLLVLILGAVALAGSCGAPEEEVPTAGIGASETARVTDVVDGDTIEVEMGGRAYRVRYLGINTPEWDQPGGARVGDTFMSLIHTAELCAVDPFDYLVQLQRHHREVAHTPADWMPWNYRETLARPRARADPQP